MKTFNYNHLFYFYIIARSGSLTQASKYLNLTKPTLSSQLRQLEDTLKAKLFDRSGRKLILTDQGAQVFSHAEQMFKISDHMFNSVAQRKKTRRNRVTIGITPMVSKSFTFKTLTPLFKSRAFFPYIKEASFDYLLKELRNKKIDLILSEAILNHANIEGTDSTTLGSNEYIFVATKKYKSKVKDFPKSIAGESFFSYTPENSLRWEIEHYFNKHEVQVEIIGEADNIGLLKSATMSGLCISALPFWAVDTELEQGALISLGYVHHYVPHVMATYNLEADKARLEKVLKMIKRD